MAAIVTGHRRLRASASDEESDGFLPTATSRSKALEHQLRSVRMMSVASVVLVLVSLALMAMVVFSSHSQSQIGTSDASVLGLNALPPADDPIRGWYRTYLDSQVRRDEGLNSDTVTTLAVGSLVYVAEAKGRHARILRPIAGWMAMQTGDGVEVLRPDMTYEASQDDASIEAVFRSRQVREANQRLQESAMKLTGVQQQLVEALQKLKRVPKHLGQKLQHQWPDIAERAPKTGEHLSKHASAAFQTVLKPQGMQRLVEHAGRNQHVRSALHSDKFQKIVEHTKHEVQQRNELAV